MTTMTTMAFGASYTAADLERMPDDGHRYEIIDGVLIVTPSPIVPHQRISVRLTVLLDRSCPRDLWVMSAPLDVQLTEDTVVQPDVIVARRADFKQENLPVAPMLAVEILSPSTRLIDLNLKKERYLRAGVAAYWTIDPDTLRFIAWELRDGAYAEVADIAGPESWTATQPFEVTITPARLLD